MPLDGDEEDERRRHVRRSGTVRKSRMTRQRSYDDEMKNVAAMSGGGAQHAHPEPGLGLPVQLPRRASAYDVYATPGAGGLNAMAIAAAQQRASISAQGTTTTIPIYPVNTLYTRGLRDKVGHGRPAYASSFPDRPGIDNRIVPINGRI